MSTSSATERPGRLRRRGQAAVETMMLAFMVAVIVVATFHLWKVTWASQNAHIRAREAVLHGTTYMSGPKAAATSGGGQIFDGSNYRKAEWGQPISFAASADDTIDSNTQIAVTATITE